MARSRAALLALGALLPAVGCTLARPTAEETDVRGRVLLRSTGRPLPEGVPMVVCARPAGSPASAAAGGAIVWSTGSLSPQLRVATAGQRVRFVNNDDIYHRFFSRSGPNSFDLELLFPGAASEIRFEHSGLVHIYCSLHAGKHGTLLVAPTSHFDTVSAGRFTITGLLPGRYVLEAWGAEQKEHSLEVSVPLGGPDHVEILVDYLPAGDSQ